MKDYKKRKKEEKRKEKDVYCSCFLFKSSFYLEENRKKTLKRKNLKGEINK